MHNKTSFQNHERQEVKQGMEVSGSETQTKECREEGVSNHVRVAVSGGRLGSQPEVAQCGWRRMAAISSSLAGERASVNSRAHSHNFDNGPKFPRDLT